MEKITRAEEFFKDLFGTDKGSKQAIVYIPDVIERAKEFTELHIQAAKEAYRSTASLKWNAGETGYLTSEDYDIAYPIKNIK